jgi:hypothetical protein
VRVGKERNEERVKREKENTITKLEIISIKKVLNASLWEEKF